MTKLNTWSIDAGYTGGSGFYPSLSKETIQVYINELKYKRINSLKLGYTICYYEAALVYEACIDQVFTTTWAGIMVVVHAETVFVFRLSEVISMINICDKKKIGEKCEFSFFMIRFNQSKKRTLLPTALELSPSSKSNVNETFLF